MESADIYVMTSDHEGLPTVVLESLTYNLPIIGYTIPPLEEIKKKIAPKDSMILVKDDVDKFVGAVIGFKKNKNLNFDLEKYNKNNIKKFEQIINN